MPSSRPLRFDDLILRPVGDRAVLVQLPHLADVMKLHDRLLRCPLDGQVDAVAAAETVLVTGVSAAAAATFAVQLAALGATETTGAATPLGDARTPPSTNAAAPLDTVLMLDTVYDGADLDTVAELTGLSRDGVIRAHSEQVWTAAFGGFAPGFAYLVGDDRLVVPRRDSPRAAVPAGSVALADRYSAVYPRVTPGGWQLIGRTGERLWDLDRARPALIAPGTRVQFRSVRATAVVGPNPAVTGRSAATGTIPAGLVVLQPGVQTTLQDLGRTGYADLGVAASGALDRAALRQANRLAGNPASAAVLENALGGLELQARAHQVVAVTGASVTLTVLSNTPGATPRRVPTHTPLALNTGDRLSVGAPHAGVRCYLAVRGGFDVPLVLGSRSTDTLSGVGPAPMTIGTALAVFPTPSTGVVGAPEPAPAPPTDITELRYLTGPRADWIDPTSIAEFTNALWCVTAQSNRIGLRLHGPALARARGGELPSEGTVSGAIQVPASGLPVLFLADHPVTGGYPVLGVVVHADLDKAAQLPTGARIRFVPVTGIQAQQSQTDSPTPQRKG
ncbi:MAG: urea amidolyase family protein [Cryobacterium sp.]